MESSRVGLSLWTQISRPAQSQHPLQLGPRYMPTLANSLPQSKPEASKAIKQGRGTSVLVANDWEQQLLQQSPRGTTGQKALPVSSAWHKLGCPVLSGTVVVSSWGQLQGNSWLSSAMACLFAWFSALPVSLWVISPPFK